MSSGQVAAWSAVNRIRSFSARAAAIPALDPVKKKRSKPLCRRLLNDSYSVYERYTNYVGFRLRCLNAAPHQEAFDETA
jgi:hypothetical protein